MMSKANKNSRFLYISMLFVISAIIVVGIMALVTEEFGRRSPRTGEPPNISGAYLFKDKSCQQHSCFFGANAKFTLGYLPYAEGEPLVHVSQTSFGIRFDHAGWENKPMHMELLNSDPGLGWDQREFTYKQQEWAAQFGVGRQSNVLHLFLDDSGSLVIKTISNKTGLALFLIPFSESRTYQVKLVRVDAS
jgi:hypothetical protein